jgi:hypothetical protein
MEKGEKKTKKRNDKVERRSIEGQAPTVMF